MSTLKITLAFLLSAGLAHAQSITFSTTAPPLGLRHAALYPETIEYDARSKRFLVGSFREGAVYAVSDDGQTKLLVDDKRLCSVLGIAVDPTRNRLWVVNADLGASVRSSGPKKLAAVGVYDLTTGSALAYVDLAALSAGSHLLNGIALDASGTAYVTDSFSPVVYKVPFHAPATVFLRDARFAGDGVNLNGVVVHPDGYLLVVKKSDGALFKIPLADPQRFTEVSAPRLVGGDGLTLIGKTELVVIANRTATVATNAALALTSTDGFSTAKLVASQPLGDVYPTTAVVRDNKLYVVHSDLGRLIAATQKAELHAEATIRQIAVVGGIRRTLIGREPAQKGLETRMYLIEYPPGAEAPPHIHSSPGIGWVVEGEFESAFGDEPPVRLKAGQGFVERPTVAHRVFRNPSADQPLRFLVAFTLRPAEEPFRLVP